VGSNSSYFRVSLVKGLLLVRLYVVRCKRAVAEAGRRHRTCFLLAVTVADRIHGRSVFIGARGDRI